ncbi:AGE family epimerase/isomerase [Gluconacetobacter tumulisoli]|uniref:Mannose-6-phosphate isomerase n=1 Tax=Gluconacetobacter tumulisoli TaxID=1286189 RepID=A0A7W4K6A2_9PROT|nr:AGE family epimerase/isomerase [Gluconacetobacter tumulisoli]MBB2201141.1 mannose-6-phosphate isomerase [Gluconacetobacter tumulisoli]
MTVFSPLLQASDNRLFNWLRDVAWPFWLRRGLDRASDGRPLGFHEHLTLDEWHCTADFRRLRVVTRQIYVFSEAVIAGVAEAVEAVEAGLNYLRRFAVDPAGGYYWRFDLSGRVIDARHDLYDHAFVLLALASAMRAIPSDDLRKEALALDSYLRKALLHPVAGYHEGLPISLPRRQNPHMHLFEACLAAAESFGDDPFLDRADDIARLFLDHLWQPAEGALPEYFDEDLVPRRERTGFVVEPGHHAEWVWLLVWHTRRRALANRPPLAGVPEAVAGLTGFIDRYGLDPASGALVDELWSDGSLRAGGQRLWPQTERLKAEILRPDATEAKILDAYRILESYLTPAPSGLWMERRHANGEWGDDPAPASSLYHLTAAITVARRALAVPS